jgi:8-oxo-dGTP pyrophosphatase MutT (NUDIX family)
VTGVPVLDAATVMLVRDGDAGLEVFMLRRNLNSDFVGGAYVFPGGAVDPQDRAADLEPFCAGRCDADASSLLGVGSGGLAFWVAAVREAFEEAGLLLARGGDGAIVDLAPDEDGARRWAEHRRVVDHGERSLLEVCRDEGLVLDVAGMHLFSHWITPVGAPRRYDTRFFVAAAPAGQVALHDDRETVANVWVRPVEALEAHRAGRFEMIFPTVRSLEALAGFERADDVLAATAALGPVPAVLPRIVADGDRIRVLVPGDAGYEAAATAEPVGPLHVDRLPSASPAGSATGVRPGPGGAR